MSSVVISGDTSGAITLAAPAAAGTNTITLAAQTGTLNAAGPAFSASGNGQQTISTSTQTKVAFNTENFDTNSNYDPTLYRFTPTVAGYYSVIASVEYQGTTYTGTFQAQIRKNNATYAYGKLYPQNGSTLILPSLVNMNGTTDYLEVFIFQAQGASQGTYAAEFSASLVRGA